MTNKIILLIMLVAVNLQFYSCSSGDKENVSGRLDAPVEKNASGISPFELIDAVWIACNTEVSVYSRDSVVATVRLRNISEGEIELYKPFLPMDSTASNSFVVLNKNLANVKYKKVGKSFYPNLLDSIAADDILILGAGSQLTYEIELSKIYDFGSGNRFYVDYDRLFPLISNAKHVLDTSYGFSRPVWFSVTSIKKDTFGHLIRKQVNLPSE